MRTVPTTFLIGPDGHVLAKNLKGETRAGDYRGARRRQIIRGSHNGAPRAVPVVRSTDAPDPNATVSPRLAAPNNTVPPRLAAPPAVVALCDTDPSFGKDRPHDDQLRLLTASGSQLWSHGGLATAQTNGGGHGVVIDRARDRVYVGESVADRITAFNLAGKKLWQIAQIPVNTLAIDPQDGQPLDERRRGLRARTASSSSTRTAAKSPTFRTRPATSPTARTMTRSGSPAGESSSSTARATSSSKNRSTAGAARRSPPIRPTAPSGSRKAGVLNFAKSKTGCGTWHPTVAVRQKIELGDYRILTVACSAKTGDAWIAADNQGIRRISADGVPGPPLPLEGQSLSISPTTGEIWLGNKDALLRLDPTGKTLAKSPSPNRARNRGWTPGRSRRIAGRPGGNILAVRTRIPKKRVVHISMPHRILFD